LPSIRRAFLSDWLLALNIFVPPSMNIMTSDFSLSYFVSKYRFSKHGPATKREIFSLLFQHLLF
jgi:hypothetical protein